MRVPPALFFGYALNRAGVRMVNIDRATSWAFYFCISAYLAEQPVTFNTPEVVFLHFLHLLEHKNKGLPHEDAFKFWFVTLISTRTKRTSQYIFCNL
jgi:hypothetical protein